MSASSRNLYQPRSLVSDSSTPSEDYDKARFAIIHADDAGMAHSVNMATVKSMESGIVSSASIMVPCPCFPEIAAYAKSHPEKDFGLHITLTSEWNDYRWGPVAARKLVPGLIDTRGYFHRKVRAVRTNALAIEVEIEARAQIEKAHDFGVPITHLDSHMGAFFSRPDLLNIYVGLGIEFNLPVLFLRNSEVGVIPPRKNAVPTERREALARDLDAKNLPILDGLTQFYSENHPEVRRQNYINSFRQQKAGVTQIIVHCGIDDSELRGITSTATNRDADFRIFTDSEFISEIKRLGIKVITWKQFHEMTRARAGTTVQ